MSKASIVFLAIVVTACQWVAGLALIGFAGVTLMQGLPTAFRQLVDMALNEPWLGLMVAVGDVYEYLRRYTGLLRGIS